MIRYLDPKYDLTFKRVFGEHKHLCISLINSMLPPDENREAVEIEYVTGEMIPQLDALKYSVMNVRCTDSYGQRFAVKIQMEWTGSFENRVLPDASNACIVQLDRTQKYRMPYPVYAIFFVNAIFEKSPEMKDEYYHHYKTVNVWRTKRRIDGLELILIELPKFKPYTCVMREQHKLWLRFLTEINERTDGVPSELLSDACIRKAIQYVDVNACNKSQLLTYDQAKMDVMTAVSALSETKEEGIRIGLAKGLAKRLAKGRAEGRAEAAAKIAVNLLKSGMSPEEVHKFTELPPEEIRKLKDGI
ncbi:MAG: Rpn family recombination-promoting nuclease/putative transposase [Tannerella sp.]|jgi:predicted transposase/invertase (TIGR01784 family)|nr:Rpn family recombination-promoting nuclease/putative transposase [Tannerella sp.]